MNDPQSSAPFSPPPLERAPRWALLGAGFGLLGAVSIWLWAPIGVSTTYPRLIGACLRTVTPGVAGSNPMLVQIGSFLAPETFLVLGLFLGGLLASRLGRTRSEGPVHAAEKTPSSRVLNAFLGGFLIIFGARMAGGCTSGHIISGITQLAMSGLVFAAAVFATGILTAKILARGGKS